MTSALPTLIARAQEKGATATVALTVHPDGSVSWVCDGDRESTLDASLRLRELVQSKARGG